MKKFLLFLFVAAMAFVFTSEAALADRVLGRKEYMDRQTFHAPVRFRDAPLLGSSPIVLEGATEDAYETTITVTDPTSDNTITFPDGTGTLMFGASKSLSATVGYTAGTGLSISAADIMAYRTFYINSVNIGESCAKGIGPSDQVGVTVVLATPTAKIDGIPFSIVNTSGTTDFFVYASGLPIDTASGTTDALTADGEGDVITLIPRYNSAVSYYIQSYRIH